jgi:methionyl-tRNA formyltransferase
VRVLCCVNRDIASNTALNLLLPALSGYDVQIALSEQVGSPTSVAGEPPLRRELRAVEQWLPNDVLFPLLERAGWPDDGERYLSFGEMEHHRGISVHALSNPNSADGLTTLRALAPDVVVSIRYGTIFKPAALASPRRGVLNLHAGLLPTYRGILAPFRALAAGDREIGCTLHYITDGTIDTGPVIGEARVAMQRDRSLFWHILALYPGGTRLITDALAMLATGESPRSTLQPAGSGAYYSSPTADEWDRFARSGWRVSDPRDLIELWRRYLPLAGAMTGTG